MRALLAAVVAVGLPACALAQAADTTTDPAKQLPPDRAATQEVPVLSDLPVVGDLFQVRDAPLTTLATPDSVTWVTPPATDKRIDVDLDNATAEQALKQICDRAGVKYELADKDLPKDSRISLHAHNVPFRTALELVTQNAGLHWSFQRSKNEWVYRFGSKAESPFVLRQDGTTFYQAPGRNLKVFGNQKPYVFDFAPGTNGYSTVFADPSSAKLLTYRTTEERATFTCPHCRGQVTMIRTRQQPKCPKCGRTFQSDWEFCPFDGSKRPASTSAWRYCPLCGKQVDEEAVK